MIRDRTFLIAAIIFSGHYNNVSYNNVELGEILGSREVQRLQIYDVEYTGT